MDYLGKYFEVVVYQYKVLWYNIQGENNLWIDTLKCKFIQCKTMKNKLCSRQTSKALEMIIDI